MKKSQLIIVEIDRDLYELLTQSAAANDNSLSEEVVSIIKSTLNGSTE
jgi:hypothetical protein